MTPDQLDSLFRWSAILAHGMLMLCLLVLFGAAIVAGPAGVPRFWVRVLATCAGVALAVVVVILVMAQGRLPHP